MGNAEQFRVRYVGAAPFASAVAQILTEEGIEVLPWSRPEERRDYQTMVESVVVYFVCKGTDAAVKAALQKVSEKLGRRGNVELDDEDPGDPDG
jgi:hypothetical protein